MNVPDVLHVLPYALSIAFQCNMIERFWRTIKQEYIYLNPTDNVSELREGIERFVKYYNSKRPHQGINGKLPINVYRDAA